LPGEGEFGAAEDQGEVGPRRRLAPAVERRDRDLVDQLAEEGGLGQDLNVEEGRGRLQGDRLQLLAAMEPGRRVDVLDRHGEDPLPGEPSEPAPEPTERPLLARADDVVAMIDRRQQGIEMGGSPRRARARDQDQGGVRPRHSQPQRVAPAVLGRDRDDDALHGASPPRKELLQGPRHRFGRLPAVLREDDDPHRGIGQGVALEVDLEGIGKLDGRRGRGRGRGR
jgi:hypothetical protein